MNQKSILIAIMALLLNSCMTVTRQSAAEMPSDYICDLLSRPGAVYVEEQRRILYAELQRRGQQCINQERIIVQ